MVASTAAFGAAKRSPEEAALTLTLRYRSYSVGQAKLPNEAHPGSVGCGKAHSFSRIAKSISSLSVKVDAGA
jgi:hypothetical protein